MGQILMLVMIICSSVAFAADLTVAKQTTNKCEYRFEYQNKDVNPLYMLEGREMISGTAFFASGALAKPKSTDRFDIQTVAPGAKLPTEIDKTDGTEFIFKDGQKTYAFKLDYLKTVHLGHEIHWPQLILKKMVTVPDAKLGERTDSSFTNLDIQLTDTPTSQLSVQELIAIIGRDLTVQSFKNPRYQPPTYQWRKVSSTGSAVYKDLGNGKSQGLVVMPDGTAIPVTTTVTLQLPDGARSESTVADSRLFGNTVNCFGQHENPKACAEGNSIETNVSTLSGVSQCQISPAKSDIQLPAEIQPVTDRLLAFSAKHNLAMQAKAALEACQHNCSIPRQKYVAADVVREEAWSELNAVEPATLNTPADITALLKVEADVRVNDLHQDMELCFASKPLTPKNMRSCLISGPSREQWFAAIRQGRRGNFFMWWF